MRNLINWCNVSPTLTKMLIEALKVLPGFKEGDLLNKNEAREILEI